MSYLESKWVVPVSLVNTHTHSLSLLVFLSLSFSPYCFLRSLCPSLSNSLAHHPTSSSTLPIPIPAFFQYCYWIPLSQFSSSKFLPRSNAIRVLALIPVKLDLLLTNLVLLVLLHVVPGQRSSKSAFRIVESLEDSEDHKSISEGEKPNS